MFVIVCGGRNFQPTQDACIWLDAFHGQFHVQGVLHGAAPGADTFARRWAEDLDIPTYPYPAQWDVHGPAAGPIRNQQMAEILTRYPHRAVLAFPGGPGTESMIRIARKHQISVYQYPSLTPLP